MPLNLSDAVIAEVNRQFPLEIHPARSAYGSRYAPIGIPTNQRSGRHSLVKE
jgi:hypothetical protein